MADAHLFIYGFTAGSTNPLATELIGLHHQPVYGLSVDGIWAMVSKLPPQNFTAIDQAALLALLADYQRVNEAVMAQSPVIPVKFGAMLPNADLLRHAVKTNLQSIQDRFEKMAGRVEINVTAAWQHFQNILQPLSETESIRDLKQQARRFPERLYDIQLQVGQQVKDAVDDMNATTATQLISHLHTAVEAHHGNPPLNDEMIFNAAFLIKQSRLPDFEARLDQLDQLHGKDVLFRLIGPLPPYSFGGLDIITADPSAINRARLILQLPLEAAKTDIRDAFRRLSRIRHPDRHPEDPHAQKRFQKIAHAWQVLDRYCDKARCSFESEAVLKHIQIIPNDLNQTGNGLAPTIMI